MRLIILLLLLSVSLTGCAKFTMQKVANAVDGIDGKVYLFQKDRVDQRMGGNRGYITGTPPPAAPRENLKRTLIGVDIELPILPGEQMSISTEDGIDMEIMDVKIQLPPKKEEDIK